MPLDEFRIVVRRLKEISKIPTVEIYRVKQIENEKISFDTSENLLGE